MIRDKRNVCVCVVILDYIELARTVSSAFQLVAKQRRKVKEEMANGGKIWDRSQLRKYDLKLEEVPRLNFDDPRIDEFITDNVSPHNTTKL